MNWEKLKIFYHVAKAGSFTSAGQHLNISQSSLSRQIIDLEKRLKIKLFKRLSAGVSLTQEGTILFEHAERIFETAKAAENLLKEESTELQGEIKILVSPYLGGSWIMPHIQKFLKDYPRVSLSIFESERIDDLGNYDAALRPFAAGRQDCIQKYMISVPLRFYASPAYLKQYGIPQSKEDLVHHRLICFDQKTTDTLPLNTHFQSNVKDKTLPTLRVNSPSALIQAAKCDLGIIELPDNYQDLAHTGLIEVLPKLKKTTVDLYLIYAKECAKNRRLKIMRDYLMKSFYAS